ncbi:MAG TPA: DNA polymerase domain-containing protein, partial [Candidatus Nanoarchaeia archaeon]|nr:DNA polymerase domain-containing protein [Candidatus Nanoarchaeia archaeon]
VKSVIKDLRNKKIPLAGVIMHTQLTKEILDYANKGPHVAAAQRLINKGRKIVAGSIIKYVVTQGSDIIRNRVKLPDEVTESDYDSDYYIHNQVVPAVERIFNVLGYTKEDLLETKDQTKLAGFF